MSAWPYNTDAWQRLRSWRLSIEPTCRYCAELGHVTPAVDVDHIEPVRKAPERAFELENTQSLCKPCHSGVKQSEERTGERRGCGLDGVPLRGWS